jgi:DNA-binding transcriptional LysR family regulator
MVVDLNELQFFVQVCKEQSFTLAAKHLGVPKSNISRAILRLEERLGVRLLERTTILRIARSPVHQRIFVDIAA